MIGYMVVVVGSRYVVFLGYKMVGLRCWYIVVVGCIIIGLKKGYVAVVVHYTVVGMVVVVVGKTIVRWYLVVGHMDVDMGRSSNNPRTDMTCSFFYMDQDTRLGAHEVHRQLVLLVGQKDGNYSNVGIRPEILWPNHEYPSASPCHGNAS
jgi:hypothetical protein